MILSMYERCNIFAIFGPRNFLEEYRQENVEIVMNIGNFNR